MRITGTVNNINDQGDYLYVAVTVPYQFKGNDRTTAVWLDFRGDRERLEVMHLGDEITAVGQIEEIKESSMDFDLCELVIP